MKYCNMAFRCKYIRKIPSEHILSVDSTKNLPFHCINFNQVVYAEHMGLIESCEECDLTKESCSNEVL